MPLVLAALLAGLMGGIHCAGMCGGIAGALAASSRGPALARALAFNAGRIASYAAAGAVAGGAGALVTKASPMWLAQSALFLVANILMLLVGLYVGGWSRALLRFEGMGTSLWRGLGPLRRAVVPLDSTPRALAAGALWGWIPCGLVYGMLPLAMASGDAGHGALVMAAFGLGTAPALLAAGVAAARLSHWRRDPRVRRAAGAILVGVACVGFLRWPGLAEAVRAIC